MAAESIYDVAIVGLGPAGAIAAALLGQAGLRVFVCDRTDVIYDKPRAISLDHEVMRVFQGLGLAQRVLPFTEPFTASEHFGAKGQMIRRLDMLAPPFPMGWTPSMVFLQPPVEKVLRDFVLSLPNITVRLNTCLLALEQDEHAVTLELEHRCEPQAAQKETRRARYLIGCDGAASTVRPLANLALNDLDFDEPWLVVDLLVNDIGLKKLPPASAQFCEPARPISFIVGTGNHRRWEIMLRPGEDPTAMQSDEQVWQLLARWITPSDAILWRRASYRFHALVAQRWRDRRVFIAGDAAHQQPPFLGQGMCQGVRDVANLSWKLQAVLAGCASDHLLDSYGVERAAHVRELTATIKQIGRYICEQDPVKAGQRDADLLAQAGGQVKTVPRQDLLPSLKQGLLSRRRGSARGTLFPQPQVSHGSGQALLDDVVPAGWTLVLGDRTDDWLLAATASLEQSIASLRCTVVRISSASKPGTLQETEGVLTAWFERHQCSAAIVRPDHYVYATLRSQDELIEEMLALVDELNANSKNRKPTTETGVRRLHDEKNRL